MSKGGAYHQKTISLVCYCILLIDTQTLTAHPAYNWYTLSLDFDYNSTFSSAGPNLGIPDNFTSNNGFDGNCFAGVFLVGILDAWPTHISLDFRTNPITKTVNFTKNSVDDVGVTMGFNIFCIVENAFNSGCTVFGFNNCARCKSWTCLQCEDGLSFRGNDSTCYCDRGALVNGSCRIIGCTQYSGVVGQSACLACDHAIACTAPMAGICLCRPDNLVNGVCEVVYYGQDCINMGYSYCSKCLARACLNCLPDFYPDANGSCSCA
jgi:hypothetical protein